jgi:hypothetical protein
LNIEPSGEAFKLVDAGGNTSTGDTPPQAIGFHMTRSTPVPHLDLKFSAGDADHPIVEVRLGPRNMASEASVSMFLETVGLPNVKVSRSTASYR